MMVWVWLGNIFQLPSPQPWPRGSKSVRLFLSVAFPRIPCLSACQHLSCLLTNSGCCFCLPRVSWNRRKKKRERERARIGFHAGVSWCEKKRGAIKYCCFVYLTQFCKLAALWLVPICGFEDVLACGECKKVHGEKAFFLRRLNTSHPTFLPLHPSLAQTLVTHSAVVFFLFSQPLLCITNTNIWGRDTIDVPALFRCRKFFSYLSVFISLLPDNSGQVK